MNVTFLESLSAREPAPALYTVQPVLTKRSAQQRKASWALPAVDLHITQVLQGLIASRKLLHLSENCEPALINDRGPGPIAVSKPRCLPPPDLGKEERRSEFAACHRIPKMEHSSAIIQSNPVQSETWWPNNWQHPFGEPVCSA